MGVSVDSSYFRRLSLGETLSRSFEIYSKGIAIFSQLGLIFLGTTSIVWGLMTAVLVPALGLDAAMLGDPTKDINYLQTHMGAFYALSLINALVAVLIGAFGEGAFVRAVADIYLKRDADLQKYVRIGIKHACAILTTSFLASLGIMVGLIFFLVPGVYLNVRWFLINPVVVIEGLCGTAAMRRSWELVSGSWCYAFCTYSIAISLFFIVQLFWQGMGGFNVYTPMGYILASIPGIVLGPILANIETIMYINMRIEKEGLNAELFARNLGDSDGGGDTGAAYSSLINSNQLQDEPIVSDAV